MKLAFIDFRDSFSYNVVQALTAAGFEVSVFTYPHHQQAWTYEFVALGPGPGHPREYQDILPFLKDRLLSKRKTFGLCLGHQLIWSALGFEVSRSSLPLHGQKVRFKLDDDWQNYLNLGEIITVQRYNSLIVQVCQKSVPDRITAFFSQDELQMSRGDSWLSYQFHPESVGTSCQKAFFSVLRQV